MWVAHKSLFRDILVYQVVKDSLNSEVRIVRRFFQGRNLFAIAACTLSVCSKQGCAAPSLFLASLWLQ